MKKAGTTPEDPKANSSGSGATPPRNSDTSGASSSVPSQVADKLGEVATSQRNSG